MNRGTIGLLLNPSRFWSRVKEERSEINTEAQKLDLQKKFGNKIYLHLSETVVMTSDRRIRVDKNEDNHGSFSVSVGIEDPSYFTEGGFGYKGKLIVCVSVNFSSSQYYPVNILKGEYDEEEDSRPGRECDDENLIAILAELDTIVHRHDSQHPL
ncbi:MAG: hypothetical protein M3Q24_01275 [bacterium]|nr:hypothetical protein [bacterium]